MRESVRFFGLGYNSFFEPAKVENVGMKEIEGFIGAGLLGSKRHGLL